MEKKSYHQLEKMRISNLMIGFLLSSTICLAVLSWGSVSVIEKPIKVSRLQDDFIVEREESIEVPKTIEPQVQQTAIQEPPPQIDLTQEITTESNSNSQNSNTDVVFNNNIDVINSGGGGGTGIDDVILVDPVEEFPDIEASFVGGELAMKKWMVDNLKYPELAIENNEQGRVFLKFIVEKDGTITHVEVIRSSSALLDYEAKRIIRSMPKWIPGESGGRKVRSSFTMPINFQLN